MDLTEEIEMVFNKLKQTLPKSKKTEMLLSNGYEEILALICKKNTNIYADLLHQMKPTPLSEVMEKSS